jgi:acetolactate synthase small subunit
MADDIKSLYRLLEPHGIAEFIQSGRIALCKHKEDRMNGKGAVGH